jgi:hypothetical protein
MRLVAFVEFVVLAGNRERLEQDRRLRTIETSGLERKASQGEYIWESGIFISIIFMG